MMIYTEPMIILLSLAGGVSTKLMPRLGEYIAAEFANEGSRDLYSN